MDLGWAAMVAPLYVVVAGCGVAWWDLRRRELAAEPVDDGPPVATDDQVERFAVERLGALTARVDTIERRTSGLLEDASKMVEEATAERRRADGKFAAAVKVRNAAERLSDGEPVNAEGDPALEPVPGAEADPLEALEAQYAGRP